MDREFQPGKLVRHVVSATTVALGLLASGADFDRGLRRYALVVIPLLVIIGVATVVRLAQLNAQDVHLVLRMNRLRRGYLDLAPELRPYFVTGHREDMAGIMQTYGTRRTRVPPVQHLSSIALLVGMIVAVLVGALAGLVADSLGTSLRVTVVLGILGAATALAAVTVLLVRNVSRTWPHGEQILPRPP